MSKTNAFAHLNKYLAIWGRNQGKSLVLICLDSRECSNKVNFLKVSDQMKLKYLQSPQYATNNMEIVVIYDGWLNIFDIWIGSDECNLANVLICITICVWNDNIFFFGFLSLSADVVVVVVVNLKC